MAKLKNHPDWEEWKASGFYQLYAMDKDNMFGPPFIRPHGAILLRQVWMNVIKHSGKRKSRNTCDGSPLIVKGVHYAKNDSACASQHGF